MFPAGRCTPCASRQPSYFRSFPPNRRAVHVFQGMLEKETNADSPPACGDRVFVALCRPQSAGSLLPIANPRRRWRCRPGPNRTHVIAIKQALP